MTALLLSLHVLAAILAIGPIAVAASIFPRLARPPAAAAGADSDGPPEQEQDLRVAAFLHRTCRAYTVVGIAVPVFGVATGAQLGVLTDAWLLASIALTAGAAALLLTVILPGQRRLLDRSAPPGPDGEEDTAAGGGDTRTATATVAELRSAAARLSMTTGVFNLVWAVVVVLMIVRPGSTTGA